jgi:hypothetical protein
MVFEMIEKSNQMMTMIKTTKLVIYIGWKGIIKL